MGVKDLWTVLTPHSERKPFYELRGKTVAIDLAGWVCESLNVVDYFVHPRQHLKNLFFRTTYLIWQDVTPVFVLEGAAPKLKSQVIAKRNEIQFRGVKQRDKPASQEQVQAPPKDKGRSRFNHVLKQCEKLLQTMGIQCVQGPGEAEAYCAFLNKKGLVDGIISQDSDCFAYGAIRVYRNFSVCTQGALAAQGGSVDIYDMRDICRHMDFGQNKVIAMALLCGCDYCPEGVGGVGRDGVLKLFNKYSENTILERLRSWRSEDAKYTALEMRVDDKSICSNCGHLGRTQSHTKNGCGVCRTARGCDESLWKEERHSLKAELQLRKKALVDPNFPSEEVIAEFQTEPVTLPDLNLYWKQPNIVKFIKQIGHLLQWPEIYCFQKFLPILTRWQVLNAQRLQQTENMVTYVQPKEILKKRVVKGVPSLELIWQDERGILKGLVPEEQLLGYEKENGKGVQELWTTIEPLCILEHAYPEMVDSFLKSKEKPKKQKKPSRAKVKAGKSDCIPLGSLENLNDLMAATDEVAKSIKPKRVPKAKTTKKGLQLIDKFFKQKPATPKNYKVSLVQCSTPKTTHSPSDLESDCDGELFDMSDIVDDIVKSKQPLVTKHAGCALHYESISKDLSLLLHEKSIDDLDLMALKRNLTLSASKGNKSKIQRVSLDDSFDILVKKPNHRLEELIQKANTVAQPTAPLLTHLSRFKQRNRISVNSLMAEKDAESNVSHFFDQSAAGVDVFEQLMDMTLSRRPQEPCNAGDFILISDSGEDE